MSETLLGKQTEYPDSYAPELLTAIPRLPNREVLGLKNSLPFKGKDVWNAYEISWLNNNGLPQQVIGSFTFDCTSPCLIESKSLKLYLNSLNQEKYPDILHVQNLIAEDLSAASGSEVAVKLNSLQIKEKEILVPKGHCLDALEVKVNSYEPDKNLLKTSVSKNSAVSLYTNLFRANCPITNQPDWATVRVDYCGPEIDSASLLAYLVSYRRYNGYHENCVEKIFVDITDLCQPATLQVQANFLRRGGLDINPIRSNTEINLSNFPRFIRQ